MASVCSQLVMTVVVIVGITGGCGPKRPPLGRVSGTVRFDGKPVANGAIIFEVPGNRPASGKIVEGALRDITTFDSGDGVPVGTARVAVHAFATSATQQKAAVPEFEKDGQEVIDPKGYMKGPDSLIPARYNDPASSGISFTIQPGENSINLDLKP